MASEAATENGAEAAHAQAAERLRAGDFAGCMAAASARLAEAPDDWEALYLLAVAQRYARQTRQAQASLERLLDLKPDYGRAYQELGHLLRAGGDHAGALGAYRQATAANPTLAASWRAMAELHAAAGQSDAAARSAQQAQWLARLDSALVSVQSFYHEGRLLKAERLCRDILRNQPANVEAMRLLAAIGVAMNELDDAEFLLESAHAFEPGNARVHADYVGVLHRRQRYVRALEEADRLLAADPGNPVYLTLVGNTRLGTGDFDGAIGAYDSVLAQWPQAETVHLSRGHALKTVGRQDEAVAAYRAAYGARPDFGDAFWSLANLKTYRFTEAEVAHMVAMEAAPRTLVEDRIHLNFALGKALEDRADFEPSFVHYARGAALKQEKIGYDPDRFEAEVDALIAYCGADLFADPARIGCAAADPIFIVGLPRAGSTLIEQILASHSQVDGTAELPNVLAIAHELSRRGEGGAYPQVLAELDAAELTRLGEACLDGAQPYRTGRPYFIDKMPNNFRHVALIRLMLPRARIIDVRRHPMACCFSVFKQLFAEGQEFSYSLEAIGRYYRDYVRLMEHWDRVLPGAVLRVHYEDVVGDLDGQVRRILDFCGLPFEPACIAFYNTERAVRTASSEQVRQPLFRSGLDQWRNYAPFLGDLEAALGEALHGYRAA